MKHKLTNFTDIEKEDIHEQYGEWNVPENHKWVKKEFNKEVRPWYRNIVRLIIKYGI